jgi:hypothetical protein
MNWRIVKISIGLCAGAFPAIAGGVAWLDNRTEVKARSIANDTVEPVSRKLDVTAAVQTEQIGGLKEDMGEVRAAQKEQSADIKRMMRILERISEKQNVK